MPISSRILFGVAAVFYGLSWVYIRQLVSQVNGDSAIKSLSLLRWYRGWKRHRDLFPGSPVRKRIVGAIALTVALGLAAFVIAAREMSSH